MKLQIETTVSEFHPQLKRLEMVLQEKDSATRQQVADIARFNFGYAPHVGGHHVAIHDSDIYGNIAGERLALVTSDTLDWR